MIFPKNFYLILCQSLYFGWLLSFPFYGPVLFAAAPVQSYGGFSLPFIFMLSHALAFGLGGLLLKNANLWKKLMLGGLGATIAVYGVLLFAAAPVWPWAMAALGVFAAGYILGWAYPYTMFVPMVGRLRLMAAVIIGSNIVYIILNILAQIVSPFLLLVISGIPLGLALLSLLSYIHPREEQKMLLPSPANNRTSNPVPMMLVFCLFIAGLYLCSGFMYNIMQPFISTAGPLFTFFRYLPYVFVILVMWYFGTRLKWYFPIYMGASLLGLAFVSFALAYRSTAGLLLTTSLIESAYAFLDLFIWTTLGDLAFIYGAPFQFFGFALSVMLFSILAGEIIGTELLQVGEHHRLVTALFSAAAIFLTFSVIPWLNERMHKDLHPLFQRKNRDEGEGSGEMIIDRAVELLLPEQKLTPRETEITDLVLKGMTNREIAKQLFISENTLKTHLRHIYPKYGVTQKRELLSLVLDKKENPSLFGK